MKPDLQGCRTSTSHFISLRTVASTRWAISVLKLPGCHGAMIIIQIVNQIVWNGLMCLGYIFESIQWFELLYNCSSVASRHDPWSSLGHGRYMMKADTTAPWLPPLDGWDHWPATSALLRLGCTPPRTCSTLTSDFSAPNHHKIMELFVYEP